MEGYVYCISNQSMPGILKIGITERTPEERLVEANASDTWRPPTPYLLEFSKKVTNPRQRETTIHTFLNDQRIHPRREFFRTELDKVRLLFNLMDGETIATTPVILDTQGTRVRHVVNQDTWIGVYTSATNRVTMGETTFTSLSDFAVQHHRVTNPTRQAANGWSECEAEVNGEWVGANALRTA
jgi:hypothetical protein